jgi:hypothetical protein
MLNPYTIEQLNAERLKDLDREADGLHFSRFARRNRQAALKAIRLWLAGFLHGVSKFQIALKCKAQPGERVEHIQ